ncbi:MAG: sigma-70 family RNA polymerase sigma factor [Oscillatoriales cyanobacterium RM1_1_9]|nr:sigma-70 family RNA polymerase sigma factor [Oscillatoriales cyanobacterium RM1_1_9]
MAVEELSLRDQSTLRTILSSKLDFVPSKLFTKSDAYDKIFTQPDAIPRPDTSWYHPVMESITDSRTGNTAGTVLLSAAQERTLFLQFNYCRHQVSQLGKQALKGQLDVTQARLLLEWYRRSEAFRDQIAQTNLALVLAMAKRTRMSDVDFSDLVSEGNMALLRAIDKFDVARGFKFSTYACRAILKAFSRMGVKLSKYRQLFPTDFDPKLERSNFLENKREGHEGDCVDEIRRIIKDNRADLSPIEKEVIEHRFALGKRRVANPDAAPLTLEQVGQIIGVTKERVRQIQATAMRKLRRPFVAERLKGWLRD